MAPSFDKLRAELNTEEGRIPWAYTDQFGFVTIGVGRLIDKRKGGRLRDAEIDFLLDNDMQQYWAEIASLPWVLASAGDEVRERALLDWYFQLRHHVFGFTMTLQALLQKDYVQAARRMRQSLWYKQTPKRAERVIRKLETGRD